MASLLPPARTPSRSSSTRRSATWALTLGLLSLTALPGCGEATTPLTLQLAHHSDLTEGAPVTLDGAVIGKVTHLKRAKNDTRAVAVLAIKQASTQQLDPDSLFVVRPIRYGDSKQQVVVSNVCVTKARGLASPTTLDGYGGLMSQILPRVAREREACMKRLGETSFKQLRAAFAVPGG